MTVGEVDLYVGLEIVNLDVLAAEISKTISFKLEEDRMPSGKSDVYKETWFEVSLMKSMIKTLNMNYDKIISDFNTFNKELKVDLSKNLKDTLSNQKDLKIDMDSIEEMTDTFMEAVTGFIKNYDFPQIESTTTTVVRETMVKSPVETARDFVNESAIVSVINAKLDDFRAVGEIKETINKLYNMYFELGSFVQQGFVSIDDAGKLMRRVLSEERKDIASRKFNTQGRTTLNRLDLSVKDITERYGDEEDIRRWIVEGTDLSMYDDIVDSVTNQLSQVIDVYKDIEPRIEEVFNNIEEVTGRDVRSMKIRDILKTPFQRTLVENISMEDLDDFRKFITSLQVIDYFNLDEEGKKNMTTGVYLRNDSTKRLINMALSKLGTFGMSSYMYDPESTEAISREIIREYNPMMRERYITSSLQTTLQADISYLQKDEIRKAVSKYNIEPNNLVTLKNIIPSILKEIEMINFEVRNVKSLKPSNVGKEIEKVIKDYAMQITEEIVETTDKFNTDEEKLALEKKIKSIMFQDEETKEIISEKLKLVYLTDAPPSKLFRGEVEAQEMKGYDFSMIETLGENLRSLASGEGSSVEGNIGVFTFSDMQTLADESGMDLQSKIDRLLRSAEEEKEMRKRPDPAIEAMSTQMSMMIDELTRLQSQIRMVMLSKGRSSA